MRCVALRKSADPLARSIRFSAPFSLSPDGISIPYTLACGENEKQRQRHTERERERERERKAGSTYERANDKTRITCNWSPC